MPSLVVDCTEFFVRHLVNDTSTKRKAATSAAKNKKKLRGYSDTVQRRTATPSRAPPSEQADFIPVPGMDDSFFNAAVRSEVVDRWLLYENKAGKDERKDRNAEAHQRSPKRLLELALRLQRLEITERGLYDINNARAYEDADDTRIGVLIGMLVWAIRQLPYDRAEEKMGVTVPDMATSVLQDLCGDPSVLPIPRAQVKALGGIVDQDVLMELGNFC